MKTTAMRVAFEKGCNNDIGVVSTHAVYRSVGVEGREHAGAYVGELRYSKQETSSTMNIQAWLWS